MTPHVSLLKNEFREFCVDHLVLRQIDDIFTNEGFEKVEVARRPGGERRGLVEEYYASGDWDKLETISRFLKVIEQVLLLSFISDDEKVFLRDLCNKSGFEVDPNGFTLHLTTKGVGHNVKNLIFAADGPKPEIVLADSVSNDIQIVKNEEYCLVFDKPIKSHGLLWQELVEWWNESNPGCFASDLKASRSLYSRLKKSLTSPPEKNLWKAYFRLFYNRLGSQLPALIPQVYLHYDPYTLRLLAGEKRLARQRMDFLLILSERTRVVIEVDGKQHYSIDGIANPKLYSEMVSEDRRLKLLGYEVYRFGGFELVQTDFEPIVSKFFEGLFKRHDIT